MAVTPHMKVAEVLKRYPQLLDVLVAQSPHFSRLKNPILRRLQARLVTVAQAAAIAGLEPAALVRTLNAAIGEHGAEVGAITLDSMAGTPPPPWRDTAPIAATVDVRQAQQRKEDPFSQIMAAVNQIPEGAVLLLRNTFEPLPLYDVLGKRGFVPWARQLGPEDWEVYFFNAGRPAGGNGAPLAATSQPIEGEPAATITIDVRDLVPPQPMMRILDALAQLRPGQTLLVHHVRRPAYLYPKLAELGCTQETKELGPDRVDIIIHKG